MRDNPSLAPGDYAVNTAIATFLEALRDCRDWWRPPAITPGLLQVDHVPAHADGVDIVSPRRLVAIG